MKTFENYIKEERDPAREGEHVAKMDNWKAGLKQKIEEIDSLPKLMNIFGKIIMLSPDQNEEEHHVIDFINKLIDQVDEEDLYIIHDAINEP